MVAESIPSRAPSPAPAARRFSSPRWVKHAPPRCAADSGHLCARRFFQNSGDAYAKIDAKPVIGDLNELGRMGCVCRRSGWAGGAAIHIDTGMNRLGLTLTEAQGIVPRINAGDHGITLVMSHLACARASIIRSTPGSSPPSAKSPVFFPACRPRCRIPPASLGAAFQFDLVRPGAALFGVNRRRKPTIRCNRSSS